MHRIALTALLALACTAGDDLRTYVPADGAELQVGALTATFAGNGTGLSGVQALYHEARPDFDAFDPWTPGASAGLNFEHLTAGHRDGRNQFAPRAGRMALEVRSDGQAVRLTRAAGDSPWGVASTLTYEMAPPHYIDLRFRCTITDPAAFDPQGYALFFFASYMNVVEDIAIHFPGPGDWESWPWAGTLKAVDADELEVAPDHDWPLNSRAYDAPRIAEPYYYGRVWDGMVWAMLFDRLRTPDDEIRFGMWAFKGAPFPAWDWGYVVHDVRSGVCGFDARAIFKPWAGREDIVEEYEAWR